MAKRRNGKKRENQIMAAAKSGGGKSAKAMAAISKMKMAKMKSESVEEIISGVSAKKMAVESQWRRKIRNQRGSCLA
jgi:hypothetical protein